MLRRIKRFLIKALGGTVAGDVPAPPRRARAANADIPIALGLALKNLALKNPAQAQAAAADVAELAAEAAEARRPRGLLARARLAIGAAIVGGLAHVMPDTQRAGNLMQVDLAEALGGSLLGDRGTLTQNEDIGFRPISERAYGKRTRDLTILSHREMINIALWLYSSNALAEWIVDTPIALVVGQEISYTPSINVGQAKDDDDAPEEAKDSETAAELLSEIRKGLDKFWYHPSHSIATRAPEYCRTFLVTGHLVLPITAVNPVNGCPQLDLVDAFQITGVNPRQGSSIVPGLVRFTPMDAGAISATERAYVVLQQNVEGQLLPQAPSEPNSDATRPSPMKFADLDLPEGIEIVGECLYFRNNKLLNSMRGVSYLMPISDWLDALDAFTWAMLDRARLRNNIVWNLKLKQVNDPAKIQAEVNKLLDALASRSGAVYASNENSELEAVNAQLGAGDSVDIGRMILTHILGSKGFPESWYSHGGGTNKSTAGEQTDVAYKTLTSLQTRFKGIFRTLLHMAYDSMQAKQPGVFPLRSASPWLSLEPNMPLIQERDTSRLAAAAGQLAAALEGATEVDFISTETARKVFLDILGQISGGAYESDEEAQKIEAEREEKEAADMERATARAKAGIQDQLDKMEQGGIVPPKPGAPVPPPAAQQPTNEEIPA